MLIPKADRKKIHEVGPYHGFIHAQTKHRQYLFREGVLVAKKDFNLLKHGDIDTKNLYVGSYQSTIISPLTNLRLSKPANPSPPAATSRPSSAGNTITTP